MKENLLLLNGLPETYYGLLWLQCQKCVWEGFTKIFVNNESKGI